MTYNHFRDLRDEYFKHDIHRRRMQQLASMVFAREEVLDVGCNSGYLREFLPIDVRYSGIDPSDTCVDVARKRYTDSIFMIAGVADLASISQKSFDVVVLGQVLERCSDNETVLEQASRIARRLVIGDTSDVRGLWGRKGHADDEEPWDARSLESFLSFYGKVITLREIKWSPSMFGTLMFAVEV